MPMFMRGCVATAILLQLCLTPLSAQQKMPITESDLEIMVLNLHLIIEGTIRNVEIKHIDSWKLLGSNHKKDNPSQTIVTAITINVERVIAGAFGEEEFTFLIEEGELDGMQKVNCDFSHINIKPGERALLAINPNTRGTGENILHVRAWLFRIEAGALVPYQPEYYLDVDDPLDFIQEKAKERDLHTIFEMADLVCIGNVTELINPRSHDRKIIVSIAECLIGSPPSRDLTIDVSELFQSFYKQQPPYRVILFLHSEDNVIRPVSGVNGYYVIRGDTLTRGHNLPLQQNLQQMRDSINIWKEAKK